MCGMSKGYVAGEVSTGSKTVNRYGYGAVWSLFGVHIRVSTYASQGISDIWSVQPIFMRSRPCIHGVAHFRRKCSGSFRHHASCAMMHLHSCIAMMICTTNSHEGDPIDDL